MRKIQSPAFQQVLKKKGKGSEYGNNHFFKPADKRPESDHEKDDAGSRIKVNPGHSIMIPQNQKQEKKPHEYLYQKKQENTRAVFIVQPSGVNPAPHEF